MLCLIFLFVCVYNECNIIPQNRVANSRSKERSPDTVDGARTDESRAYVLGNVYVCQVLKSLSNIIIIYWYLKKGGEGNFSEDTDFLLKRQHVLLQRLDSHDELPNLLADHH